MKLFSAILLLMVGTVVGQASFQGGANFGPPQAEAPWVKIWQKDDLGGYPVMECLGLAANYSVKKDSFCCMKPFGTDKIPFCFQWDGKIWEGVAGPSGDLKLYEAEDVPAIQEKPYWTKPKEENDPFQIKGFREGCEEAGLLWSPLKGCRHILWTCKDTRRVLLTSVDGSIHVCHKVTP